MWGKSMKTSVLDFLIVRVAVLCVDINLDSLLLIFITAFWQNFNLRNRTLSKKSQSVMYLLCNKIFYLRYLCLLKFFLTSDMKRMKKLPTIPLKFTFVSLMLFCSEPFFASSMFVLLRFSLMVVWFSRGIFKFVFLFFLILINHSKILKRW